MTDILGDALKDYQQGIKKYRLVINNRYGRREIMPVSTYFRPKCEFTKLEMLALESCEGKVLDVGAAAGIHALILQEMGYDITALDMSPGAAEVMKQSGLHQIINADIFTLRKKKFDTILFLMNGIGLAGSIERLPQLLESLKDLLSIGGQILFDSSDIAYLYSGHNLPKHYYGEIDYEYVYRGKHSGWFKWLYIDKKKMAEASKIAGFQMKLLYEDEYGQYLAKLTRR